MTAIEKRATFVDLEEADAGRNLELAAARVEVRASYLLRQAFELSEMSQKRLAERVGVTEGRVSQVLRSDGNLKITTVARFLRAMGYRLELSADPADLGVVSLAPVKPPRKSRRQRDNLYLGSDEQTGAPTKMLITLGSSSGAVAYDGFVQVGSISSGTTSAISRTVLRDMSLAGQDQVTAQTLEVEK